jgi:DNA-binding Lrp family transcriptional regulator
MAAHVHLDETDERIVALLREDARRTVADIAARVNLSPAPVRRRIDRLERSGVIAGYTLVVDHSRLGPSLEAFVELRLAGSDDVEELNRTLRAIPAIEEICTIAGDPDAMIRIRVDGVEHLRDVVNELRRNEHVIGTKTMMVLDRWTG